MKKNIYMYIHTNKLIWIELKVWRKDITAQM